jgi:6-phosphogluconolactonase
MTPPDITIAPDAEGLRVAAAEQFVALAAAAVAARGVFTVALAGGGTPRPVYELLATEPFARRVDWPRVHVFFGDERCVGPDDPQSNYRMAREALLSRVSLPAANVHRIRGEEPPELAALAYELELRAFFRTERPPALDLIWLGMGENGHTASLFPGTAALRERARWVVAQYVEVVGSWRVTFTLPLINAAREAAFLVEGVGKAATLRRVLRGPYQPDVLPAQLVRPAGRLRWLVDAAANGA